MGWALTIERGDRTLYPLRRASAEMRAQDLRQGFVFDLKIIRNGDGRERGRISPPGLIAWEFCKKGFDARAGDG